MTSYKSPFQQWLDANMQGMGASQEIMLLLAKAFEGGRLYEQEDCAKVCEEYGTWHIARMAAAAIRARKF